MRKKFLSYNDDDGTKIKGHFEIIEETLNYIKFKSGLNEIKIPWNRVLKLKSKLIKGGKDKI